MEIDFQNICDKLQETVDDHSEIIHSVTEVYEEAREILRGSLFHQRYESRCGKISWRDLDLMTGQLMLWELVFKPDLQRSEWFMWSELTVDDKVKIAMAIPMFLSEINWEIEKEATRLKALIAPELP